MTRKRSTNTMSRRRPASPGSRILDDAVIAGIEGLGEDMLTELISLYFEQAAEDLTALGDAVGRNDPLALTWIAHALKGSSSTLGAERVTWIAGELEAMAKTGDLTAAHGTLTRLGDGIDDTRRALQERSAQRASAP